MSLCACDGKGQSADSCFFLSAAVTSLCHIICHSAEAAVAAAEDGRCMQKRHAIVDVIVVVVKTESGKWQSNSFFLAGAKESKPNCRLTSAQAKLTSFRFHWDPLRLLTFSISALTTLHHTLLLIQSITLICMPLASVFGGRQDRETDRQASQTSSSFDWYYYTTVCFTTNVNCCRYVEDNFSDAEKRGKTQTSTTTHKQHLPEQLALSFYLILIRTTHLMSCPVIIIHSQVREQLQFSI